MSLQEKAAAKYRKTGPKAAIDLLLATLDPELRHEVISLVWDVDPRISTRAIADVLNEEYGHLIPGRITGQQVRNHRLKPRAE